jgi:hypothetical protein
MSRRDKIAEDFDTLMTQAPVLGLSLVRSRFDSAGV